MELSEEELEKAALEAAAYLEDESDRAGGSLPSSIILLLI